MESGRWLDLLMGIVLSMAPQDMLMHVEPRIGHWVYYSHWLTGFSLHPIGKVKPDLSFWVAVLDPSIDPHQWCRGRFSVATTALDLLRFPRWWPVRNCVTKTADVLRCHTRCRTAQGLADVIRHGGVGDVISECGRD